LTPAGPNSALSGTETPVLLLAAGHDTWSEDELRLWSGSVGAVKTGSMGPEKSIAAIRNYVAAFLDEHLLGKPIDPLLAGPSSEFPDATVTTRKELLRAKY
jgi:hypothetical protein